MSPEQEALARRAVACAAWRWMPGMLLEVAPGQRQRLGDPDYTVYAGETTPMPGRWWWAGWEISEEIPTEALPDLTDPATLGCLLALVRDAWEDPNASPISYFHHAELRKSEYRWSWHADEASLAHLAYERSEAAALVAAFEAAPVRR